MSLALSATAATVQQSGFALEASEQSCAISRPATVVEPTARQVFYRLILGSVAATDRLTLEWVDPSGGVAVSVPYELLPAAASLCFVSQLPMAGFAAATQAGEWRVRVVVNGALLQESRFRLKADPAANSVQIRTTSLREISPTETELVAEGFGFTADSVVNLAQYTAAGGWTYLHALFPLTYSSSRLTVRLPSLSAAEYLVILRNNDGKLSAPARFVISRGGYYRLPTPAGQAWVLTQGPYGSFSHWGRSLHAYDIAPLGGTCVVAMRGGVVSAYDLGYGQTPNLRIFGNYITIAHDNGEFSHYAHLRSGTFRVRTGQVVEQGQALATVGTSGYSFGAHVHVHVTRAHWISTPSIPFQFEDLPAASRTGFRGTFASGNSSAYGSCSSSLTPPASVTRLTATPAVVAPTWTGQVGISDWWTKTTTVGRGARAFDIKVMWDGAAHDLDLHLVSPSGRHFSPWDDTTGYAPASLVKEFRIPNPEPGVWRVSVQGTRGAGEAIPFRVFQAAL